VVFYNREDAEEQAAGDSLETGEGFVAVRIVCTPEAQAPTI
jgi:hypothetical protein